MCIIFSSLQGYIAKLCWNVRVASFDGSALEQFRHVCPHVEISETSNSTCDTNYSNESEAIC